MLVMIVIVMAGVFFVTTSSNAETHCKHEQEFKAFHFASPTFLTNDDECRIEPSLTHHSWDFYKAYWTCQVFTSNVHGSSVSKTDSAVDMLPLSGVPPLP